MWRKIARVSGYMFAVALVIAYMCCASNLARKHRANQRVEKIIISLPDNSDMLNFTSAAEIIQDLEQNGFKVNNSSIGSIDAAAISKHIARLGYVKDVNAYVTYKGELYIDVRQHKPVLRLLSGGLNSYVSADGHIFRVPEQSVCYTPVVTGSYQPLFPCDYEGKVSSYYSELIGKEERTITELDNKLSALNKKKKKVLEKLSKAGRSKVDKYRDQLASLSSQEEALQEEKQKFENRKKKLQKKRTDFANLTNFVSEVGKDSFWSAEIVQCVADTTNTGEISLSLIPRSGDFVITFGTLDNRTEKLAKLQKFYDKGLAHVGWNRYKTVDVRYDKQIICKE
jgi:cell division septal protein FtsQ